MRRRATVMVLKEGRALLVMGHGQDRWSFPGGGIEEGETVVEAAIRELSEEVGLSVTKMSQLEGFRFSTTQNRHEACLAETKDEPRLGLEKPRVVERFMWWDMKTPVAVSEHVTAILGAHADSQAHQGEPKRGEASLT